MFLLRIILLVILIYYLLKLLGKWVFSDNKGTRAVGKGRDKNQKIYRNLTDQAIDDADYEEIDGGEER